jgi:polyvinyl alcohol dehydrogenase (cytochrome)
MDLHMGYSGGAVWQPPVIDAKRGTLFIGTGNNYTAPADVEACENMTPLANCEAANDFFDTALALDLKTGQIKWAKKLEGFDTWTVACILSTGPNPNCPVPTSQDFDLGGAGPNLVGNIVGFGQKSGIYWALNPDNGNVVWCTPVGPGASLGGIEWGTATDGQRILRCDLEQRSSAFYAGALRTADHLGCVERAGCCHGENPVADGGSNCGNH